MTNTDGMQHKFRVIKEDDIKNYLSEKERFALNHLQAVIALGRESDGKPNTNEYLVVNTDESYADDIIDILKENGDWGQSHNVPSVDEFINKQVKHYLNEEQITLTQKEQQQLENSMVALVVGRIGNRSWHFDAEIFRLDIARVVASIKKDAEDDEAEKDISKAEMERRVDEYINFNGMGFSGQQRQEILNHLDSFRDDNDIFENEMVCEVRTMNGD